MLHLLKWNGHPSCDPEEDEGAQGPVLNALESGRKLLNPAPWNAVWNFSSWSRGDCKGGLEQHARNQCPGQGPSSLGLDWTC